MIRRKNESTAEYIERWRIEYKKITPMYNGQINATVNFTSEGFNHLIFKHGRRRPLKVIESRLPYIKLIPFALSEGAVLGAVRVAEHTIYGKKRQVIFYPFVNTLHAKHEDITVKVIVKKVGNNGTFIFQSVMCTRLQKKPKNTP